MTAVTTSIDGALPLARRRLADADPRSDAVPVWDHGVCRWSDSLYTRLRGAMVGRTARISRAVAGSRLPCRVDVLTLLVDIDATVGSWEPDAKGTLERLRQLAARGFRPQDCALLDGYSAVGACWCWFRAGGCSGPCGAVV